MNFIEAVRYMLDGGYVKNPMYQGFIFYEGDKFWMDFEDGAKVWTPDHRDILSENWEVLGTLIREEKYIRLLDQKTDILKMKCQILSEFEKTNNPDYHSILDCQLALLKVLDIHTDMLRKI